MLEEEILDVVDKQGNVLETRTRSEIHGNPDLMHRVVHVLVFNSRGDLLLQKRSTSKDVAPGKWDTSVGGHVNAGESLLAACARETEEELGIIDCPTEFLYTYIHSNTYESELVYTYRCIYDGEITYQEDEIDAVKPWDIKDIKSALGTGVLSDNFEHEFKTYTEHTAKN